MEEHQDAVESELPTPAVLEVLAPYMTESIIVVDGRGTVRSRLGSPLGVLGHGKTRDGSVFANVHPDDLPRLLEFGTAVTRSEPGWQGTIPVRLTHAERGFGNYEIHVVNHLEDPIVRGIVVRTRELPAGGPIVVAADPLDFSGEAVAESIAEAVPMPLLVLSQTGRVEFANESARRLCALPDDLGGDWRLTSLATPADRPLLAEALTELCMETGTRTVTFAMDLGHDGEPPRQIEARLVARGLDDRPSTTIALLEDITDRRLEEAELRRRATIDPLTGVLNRAALLDEVSERLERGPVTAIYCDLDGFKLVNDTRGHASGDEVLARVADLLRSLVRPTDLVGRVGGDEFVIVCDGLADRSIANLIARMDAAVGGTVDVRISLGVAGAETGGDAADLIARADRAMYDNKRRSARASTAP